MGESGKGVKVCESITLEQYVEMAKFARVRTKSLQLTIRNGHLLICMPLPIYHLEKVVIEGRRRPLQIRII